jgi:hypothetical protein
MTEALYVLTAIAGLAALGALLLAILAYAADVSSEPAGIVRVPSPRPRRYDGCITCEAADATSRAALIRHETTDHGAVRW